MTVRHPPLAAMSPFEDREGSDVSKLASTNGDIWKSKTLLLEKYKLMYSNMHEETSEKIQIGTMIEEIEANLEYHKSKEKKNG